MAKKLLYLCGAFVVVVALFFVLPPEEKASMSDVLVVAMHPGYAPYETVDAAGNVVGFDVDVAKEIARQLNRDIKIVQAQFDSLVLGVKTGKYDLIISGISITPDRLQEIAMVPYYGEAVTHACLTFWESIPEGVSGIEDLSDIAVQQGTWQELFLRTVPDTSVRSLEGNADLVMDLQYGKSSAVLFEKHVVQALQKQFPQLKTVPVPLPEHYQVYGDGIGIRKDNAVLIEKVQGAVKTLQVNGVIVQLEAQWFGGEQ